MLDVLKVRDWDVGGNLEQMSGQMKRSMIDIGREVCGSLKGGNQ